MTKISDQYVVGKLISKLKYENVKTNFLIANARMTAVSEKITEFLCYLNISYDKPLTIFFRDSVRSAYFGVFRLLISAMVAEIWLLKGHVVL